MMRITRLKRLFLTGLAATTAAAANGRDDMGYTVVKELIYSQPDERGLRLDLFLPQAAPKPVPCVIVIQGGGFRSQDGQRFRPFAEHLASNGLAAALIEYRGLPDHTYRDTIADIKAATRFVRKTGPVYDIDPHRIGAMGRSAGATLAALLAVTGDVEELEGEGGHAGVSSRIQAAVGIAGVYDFVARFSDQEQIALQPNLDAKIESNVRWIGSPYSPTSKAWLDASAINHVDTSDPPMLLMHSKNDRTVPWQQSRSLHQAMIRAGVDSEAVIAEDGGHRGPADAEASMVAFLKRKLAEPGDASRLTERKF